MGDEGMAPGEISADEVGMMADDALVYVLQANQYHHDYSIGQRATRGGPAAAGRL